jgi:hypothetical protein
MSEASNSTSDLDSIAASIAESIAERIPETHNDDASIFHGRQTTLVGDASVFAAIYGEELLRMLEDCGKDLDDPSLVEFATKVKAELSKIIHATPSLVAAEESTRISTIAQNILKRRYKAYDPMHCSINRDTIGAERQGRLKPDPGVYDQIFLDEIAYAIQEYGQGSGKKPIHDLEQKVHDEMVRITTGQDKIGEVLHWPESLCGS